MPFEMQLTRMSSKGQVVIPQAIRSAHAWTPGVEFEVEDRPEGLLLRPRTPFAPTSVADVVGCAGYAGPRRSLAEMRRATPPGQVEET